VGEHLRKIIMRWATEAVGIKLCPMIASKLIRVFTVGRLLRMLYVTVVWKEGVAKKKRVASPRLLRR
jgi:hypothetical protein